MRDIIGILIFSICLIITGFSMLRSILDKKGRCSSEVTGKIVDVNHRLGASGGLHSPVVEFKCGFKMVKAKAGISSHFESKFKIGDGIQILCDPNDPETFIVKGKEFNHDFFWGGFFIVFGVFLMVICVFLAFR